jgi:hypothetical protein
MFGITAETVEVDRVTRFCIECEGERLSYSAVINLWQHSLAFQQYFTGILAESPFKGFRWETPSLTTASANRPCEFVLVNTPGFAKRTTDRRTYAEYFTDSEVDDGVVSFANLRKDATLVVPSPRGHDDNYGHLAAFVRGARSSQVNSLWRVLGRTIESRLTAEPIWVSTAGGGVAWLHVRIDRHPKYYAYEKYKSAQ